MGWLNNRRIWGFNTVELFLLLAVVTMPYHNNLNSYCVVAFSVVALFSNGIREKIARLKQNKLWMLPAAYFVWLALSLLWDNGPDRSMNVLEKSTSFIALPLMLGSIRPLNRLSIRRIFLFFVVAVVAAALYCLWQAYLAYKATDYINVFFYHHLSMNLGLNAIYFSLYCVFSVWILLCFIFFGEVNIRQRAMALIVTFFLIIFTILLASKMLLAILFASLFIVTIYSFVYMKKLRGRLVFLIIFLAAIPAVLLQFPYVRARIDETKLLEYRTAADRFNGLAVRGTLWKASWKLIRERPIIGYGHYAAQRALEVEYQKAGLKEAVKERFNSHNQYLYTWCNYGIIGLLLVTGYLVLFLTRAVREKHMLAIIFGSIFLIANLTECMLQVQKGIVFYMLFSSLFLFHIFETTNKQVVKREKI
ncbi:MAG: O-antigen ligase family protein [Flavisolibacter sp.]